MTHDIIANQYFNWMCGLVYERKKSSYKKLLNHLHNIDFTYILELDGNREEDGINLRYRFGYEFDYPRGMIAAYLDTHPCSVLEMMVALAHRCEEDIMDNPEYGDRTGKWFWDMIDSLGLSSMDDNHFDEAHADEVIYRFLHREYQPNGKGGLFTVNNCRRDMRALEIWYQMNWYLADI